MIASSKIVALVLTLVTLSACSIKNFTSIKEEVEEVAIQELAITVMHKADYNIDDSQTVKDFKVLTTDTDYRTELARYSIEVPRSVDFSQSRVLVSTMGTQTSGGYVVTVVKAEDYADKVVVTVALNSPAASCITTQAFSNPYEFVVLQTTKPIEFIESAVVNECA